MTDEQLIEAAFARGVEAQKGVSTLPVPDGTNPTGLQKLAVCLPFFCGLFAPLFAYEITGDEFVSGFIFGLSVLGFIAATLWLVRKAGAQQEAIEERNMAYLGDARALAQRELVRT